MASSGVLVGGPNYKLEDAYIKATEWNLNGRAAKCYIDEYMLTFFRVKMHEL